MNQRVVWPLAFVAGEAVAGYLSNSLALLSDAGHNLADAAALGLSWYAARVARRPAPGSRCVANRSSSCATGNSPSSWTAAEPSLLRDRRGKNQTNLRNLAVGLICLMDLYSQEV